MFMFKALSLVALTLMAPTTIQAKPYLNALNDAVASYLAVPAPTSASSVAAAAAPVQIDTNQLLQAQPSGAYSMISAMPDYIQSAPAYQQSGPAQVSAAVQTKRTVEVKPIMLQSDPIEPHIVDVEASFQPVQVVFRSSSSPVMVQQIHTPAQPIHVEPTQSEDEPHRVQHQVMRPVIQEIREIIQPYRRVLQEIRPVLEEVRTIVAKAEGTSLGGPGAGAGAGAGMGGGGAGAGAGAYGGQSGGQILLGNDGGYGAAAASSTNQQSYVRSPSPARKNYSRRSASAKARHYIDRARS